MQVDRSKRSETMSRYKWILRKRFGENRKWNTNDFYYKKPLNEKAIYVQGLGRSVMGNMRYVLDVLNHDEAFKGYSVIVRTSKRTDEIVRNLIKLNGWERTTTAKTKTEYYMAIETCKYLIAESFIRCEWVARSGQVFVNTWHGTPLKHLGFLKNGKKRHLAGQQQANFINARYLLAPNNFTLDVMTKSYQIGELTNAEVLMLGYPRVGGMLAVTDDRKSVILEQIAPNGEKIILYMPTFRGYENSNEAVVKKAEFLKYMDENLDEGQLLYVNLHHSIHSAIDYSAYKRVKQFPSNIDSYEMLSVADVMISDYSSVFYDYLSLRRQIILFAYDYEEYKEDHGFNVDMKQYPLDIAYTKEDVLAAIRRGKQYDDTELWNEICRYDTTESARILCHRMLGENVEVECRYAEKNGLPNTMVYIDCPDGGRITEKAIKFIEGIDRSKTNLFIACNSNEVDKEENIDKAYPLLNMAPVLGGVYSDTKSREGEIAYKKYMAGRLSFKKAIDILKYDYSLIPIKMFGKVHFDKLIIYDVCDPELLLGLTMIDANEIEFYIHEDTDQEIREGNSFLKDAVEYVSHNVDRVISKEQI